MKYPVNNDDDDGDEKNNHDNNNNEQYTYSIVGPHFKSSMLYFIIKYLVMDLGHRQWLYKLYNHIQRRQLDSQASLYAFLEICTSDSHD